MEEEQKRKKCEKGTRFNRKTKRCEPHNKTVRKSPSAKPTLGAVPELPTPVFGLPTLGAVLEPSPVAEPEPMDSVRQEPEPEVKVPVPEVKVPVPEVEVQVPQVEEPVPEVKVQVPQVEEPVQKRKKCEKGTRFNKKTNKCEPNKKLEVVEEPKEASAQPKEASAEPKEASAEPKEASAEPVFIAPEPKEASAEPKEASAQPKEASAEPKEASAEPKEASAQPRKRCEKGTRYNKKTKKCEPHNPKKRTIKKSQTTVDKDIQTSVGETPRPSRTQSPQKELTPTPEVAADTQISPLEAEKRESDILANNPIDPYLYPHINDSEFNQKIADREEFHATQYDGTLHPFETRANELCIKKSEEFELMPHQLFVKNFMSRHTPYTSILLYHGLGTGKTCSGIGIAEETRKYNRQIGSSRKIYVIAAPNVQDNFRAQLFHEDKLVFENGVWNLNTCIGNTLLQEINVNALRGMQKKTIIKSINDIIHKHYRFMGYRQFSNYIHAHISIKNASLTPEEITEERIKNIRRHFNDAMIIIDEVHNVHQLVDDDAEQEQDEPKKKLVAREEPLTRMLMELAIHTNNLRFVLMSATPIFNTYSEIIWLINLMNVNDKRPPISIRDVFDSRGEFVQASSLNPLSESGDALLRRKLIGYISFVRGENPYIFPYRVYPADFAPPVHLLTESKYPKYQMTGSNLDQDKRMKHIQVYLDILPEDTYQGETYKKLMDNLVPKIVENTPKAAVATTLEEEDEDEDIVGGARVLATDVFGFKVLRPAMQALNIVFPGGKKADIQELIGLNGLRKCIHWTDGKTETGNPILHKFKYVSGGKEIFKPTELPKYSVKIDSIMKSIEKSQGIVLIYTKYVFGGAVPLALALEERGFNRYCSNREFKNLLTKQVSGAPSYAMITGNRMLSPTNAEDVNYLGKSENANGEKVKVVIISDAGSEGLDFKNIRQVHILDPWYNMNKIEQIIGRAVRNYSHCGLKFEERNVEIYMHAVLFGEKETADLYMYRLAENKAMRGGKITRIMKESAVDCLINKTQRNFTQSVIETSDDVPNEGKIQIHIASIPETERIEYAVGDREYSHMCDYMPCEYQCIPTDTLEETPSIPTQYTTDFLTQKQNNIMRRIRDAFRERSVYHRNMLFQYVNAQNRYTMQQFLFALTTFIQNQNEVLVNGVGHKGYLVNRGEYYAFQPAEITDESISQFDRDMPIQVRPIKLRLELKKEIKKENFEVMNPAAVAAATTVVEATPAVKRNSGEKVFRDIVKKATEMTTGKSWYAHANHCISELFNGTVFDKITEKQRVSFITQHYLENDISMEYRLALYSEIMKMTGPTEEGVSTIVFGYLRDKLTNKIITMNEYQYLFIWDGKYSNVKKQRVDMYTKLSNKNLLDLFAEHMYVWENNEWKVVSLENGEHTANLKKIQSTIFGSASQLKNVSKVFGFSKPGFALYVKKEGELNVNKGALCSNKNKVNALKSLREEVLGITEETNPQWLAISVWFKDKDKDMVYVCAAIELYLQLWDSEHKNKQRHYLDMEEFFVYQYSQDKK